MSHTSDGFASLMRVLHSKWFRQRRRLEKNVHAQVSTFSLALALLLVGLHLLRWLPDLRVHAPTCSLRGQQPTRLCLSMPSPNTIIMMSTRCRREVPGGGGRSTTTSKYLMLGPPPVPGVRGSIHCPLQDAVVWGLQLARTLLGGAGRGKKQTKLHWRACARVCVCVYTISRRIM